MIEASNLFNLSRQYLAQMSYNGIRIDIDGVLKEQKKLESEIENKKEELYNTEEALWYKKKYGAEIKDSNKGIGEVLFNFKGLKPIKETKKGNYSVDEEVLGYYASKGNIFCKSLLDLRKIEKRKSTYVDNLILFADTNNYIHPDFNLTMTRSYRSSCDSPNIHNFPKRQEEGHELRRFIFPSPGNELFSVDYSGNEVRGMACYSKDKNLIDWLWKDIDPHRYWAAQIYRKKEKEVTKQERYDSKNGFVFPLFYGSYYKPIAENLKMDQFWIRDIEREFWSIFGGIREWQESYVKEYERKGFVELFFGFRRPGPLSRNQIFNTPVQGSSFHLVLLSIIRIGRYMQEKELKSKMIGEIHDNILFDMIPEESEDLVLASTEIMENPDAKWAKVVPWKVDWEYGLNWRDMEEL